MPLSSEELRLFARHLLLSEIAEEGQARLLASRYRVPEAASQAAAGVARTYLDRAGLGESPSGAPVALPSPDAVTLLAGRPELELAAATLGAALASVERIKGALGVGEPGGDLKEIVLSRRAG